MTGSNQTLPQWLGTLKADLERQGARVVAQVERAVEALFEKDGGVAQAIFEAETEIDREDVRIERETVALLQAAADAAKAPLSETDVRLTLTIVKTNNELERIADLAVYAAQRVPSFAALTEDPPPTFRVLANSVIGIVQCTQRALVKMDVDQASLVLRSDDTTDAFKLAILREVEEKLAAGAHDVDYAFALHTAAAAFARIADHCTNIAEQVIYTATGQIVRHENDRWTDPTPPE